MRVAAVDASSSSSILPISLGATKAAKTVSAQSNTNAANSQFLLSDAKADIKRQVSSVYEQRN